MQSQSLATIPQDQAQTALISSQAVSKDVSPAYVWKTGKTFFLSKKEKVVADTFLKTRNYSECARALGEMGVKRGYLTCRRWLERGHIREYLAEQFEEKGITSGWTEEHWLAVMTRHLDGRERLKAGDLYAMKLIADMKGFKKTDGGTNIINQINFTEKA